jgi:hypothetical protein
MKPFKPRSVSFCKQRARQFQYLCEAKAVRLHNEADSRLSKHTGFVSLSVIENAVGDGEATIDAATEDS